MNRISKAGVIAAIASAAVLMAARQAVGGTVQQITAFGNNPTGLGLYIYTPNGVGSRPPILVGVHACHGKGTDVCASGTPFAAQADTYGLLLVCPSASSSDGCWDVHSTAVLTHDGGDDASGIVSMVNYVVQNKNGDGNRVFVAGHSSGGMMTNVLIGSYPDVFKAGAAFAGVPFACFAQGSVDGLGWNASCANGNVSKTGPQWGDLVRAAYPGFTGPRPRMQLWHGTADATVKFQNFGEEIKQWTNVLGVSETPTTSENNAIKSSWIRTRYVDARGVVQVEAIQETGQPHNLVLDLADAIRFFGLDGSMPAPDGGASGSGGGPGLDGGVSDVGGGSGGRGGGAGGAVGDGGRSGGIGAAGNAANAGSAGTSMSGVAGASSGGATGGNGTDGGTGGVPAGSGGREETGGAIGTSGGSGGARTGTGGNAMPTETGGAPGAGSGGMRGTGGRGNAEVGEGDSAACNCDSAGSMNRTWLGAILLALAFCFRPGRVGSIGRGDRWPR